MSDADILTDRLRDALADATDTVVVYTDLQLMRLWGGSREHTLAMHAGALLDAVGDRTLVVPTFNYDFCETGRYDSACDRARTGVLNEHLRRYHSIFRTHTPVFNFAVIRWSQSPGKHATTFPRRAIDPFGAGSVLAWLAMQRATVLAYGAPLHRAAAVHLAERWAHVPYRYIKTFGGHVARRGPTMLQYFVQPPEGVAYDWDGIDALVRPHFTARDVGCGTVHTANAGDLFFTLLDALRRDPHALLRGPPHDLYARYGRPLTYEAVEGPEAVPA